MQKLLITGASGLIGQRLTEMLLQKGRSVNRLGRRVQTGEPATEKRARSFVWNIEKGEMDESAFEGVDTIIHLAGAGVADKRWTDSRKREIVDSRVKSAKLIYDFLKKGRHSITAFISASAVGYYGDCGDILVTENMPAGKGFLAEVCNKWEDEAINIGKLGIREIRCRIGIVLAKNGGALPELTRTIPFGFAGYFAKSNLYYPWVHLDDVCGIMMHAAMTENINGAYNSTAPTPLLLKDLMKEILKAKKSKALLIPTPAIAIKLALGEMSEMLLSSARCSCEKIQAAGYAFKFASIGAALGDLVAR